MVSQGRKGGGEARRPRSSLVTVSPPTRLGSSPGRCRRQRENISGPRGPLSMGSQGAWTEKYLTGRMVDPELPSGLGIGASHPTVGTHPRVSESLCALAFERAPPLSFLDALEAGFIEGEAECEPGHGAKSTELAGDVRGLGSRASHPSRAKRTEHDPAWS